ncbi:hypothetical protein A2690_00395 [Candidatus Roizmanbacteria bacterium RIFCSPHIGHO2_01_FULL_39_12b]|uniref:M23ase beta-sheet core domain-containing protein n=1 Tax=Candidatus Roizmanbacteria bacterium RIFCSPHIGHO2_01_FULL_39_12b TaxID=1802030 RepID=A0A1F7G8J6_9BACT|nr:MAG: hypothetical protein A2690_00395 [Candidatus Roizmanbacteria bacterium RIFCSPHIGHO2_01_FULL_39_12b]OGK46026.1 MAG: hypothetical protein A3B46_00685 [Candidatus Roizmanbacteria bacterium RIFCSPLOWO2_01_FULL_39_19]
MRHLLKVIPSILPRIILLSTLVFCFIVPVSAGECINANECKKKIEEYEKKLGELKEQKNNLSSELARMDTQIYLTSARIENTQHLITQTTDEIESLGSKIGTLDASLSHLSKLLLQKISESYKSKDISLFEIFLDSNSAHTFIGKAQYLKAAQRSDQKVAYRLQQAKFNYEEQKELREKKKQELENLTVELNKQKTELDSQKKQKQTLLEQTQNDQKKYSQLLSQALAEFQAIERAVATGSVVGPVKKGEPIALVGNTGYPNCSTGAHLHFEVRRSSQWTDPLEFLSAGEGGRGSWDWPLQSPIIITQGYGHTPYSWRYAYSGGVHTGIDMVSRSSDVIRAPEGGTLYTSSQNCGGPIIKIKYIDHGSGIMSFFLHVQ